VATADIEAGMELFADYGEQWYLDRGDAFRDQPQFHHYEEADRVVKLFREFVEGNSGAVGDVASRLFWDFVRKNMVTHDLVARLLPESIENLQELERKGVALWNAPKDFIRSAEWLEENGLCMDNLRAGISTVPQAGRGAFATRFLPEGSIITPMPLIHHYCKNSSVYHPHHNYTSKRKQILLNYCFGHATSSLLLCPYGALTALVNHNSHSPNAKIRWSTSKHHNPHWLNMPLKELCQIQHTALMFDLIATRNISPGEEVFIHYGQEWETAWNKHIHTWTPPKHSLSYTSASTLNQTQTIIKTIQQQQQKPYPNNVYTECYFQWIETEQDFVEDNIHYKSYKGHKTNYDLRRCSVKSRTNDTYTAGIIIEGSKVIVEGLPRSAIRFSDQAYTTDAHLHGAFRKEIGIEDEMFPEAWSFL